MNTDSQLAESIRDGSHSFKEGPGGLLCSQCGLPRWRHVDDGFRATLSPRPTPDQLKYGWRSNYRRHPGWTKPGSFRRKEDEKEKNS